MVKGPSRLPMKNPSDCLCSILVPVCAGAKCLPVQAPKKSQNIEVHWPAYAGSSCLPMQGSKHIKM